MTKKKYTQGQAITSLDEMMEQEFVMYHKKVYHKGWVGSWSLHYATLIIKRGDVFQAVKIGEEPAPQAPRKGCDLIHCKECGHSWDAGGDRGRRCEMHDYGEDSVPNDGFCHNAIKREGT